MSTDTDTEWSDSELLAMNEREARETLTVAWFDRWEKLNDLHAEADETRDEWRDQDATVQELTVNADLSDLGTDVELYGNDIVVHLDPEDPEVKRLSEKAEEVLSEYDSEGEEVSDGEIDQAAGFLVDLFDEMLVEWNGVEWADVPEEQRRQTLQEARESWGVMGLANGKARVLQAIYEEQDERMDVIEKFRRPERRGRR